MANLQGNGVPSTSTVGNVDDIYVDTITNLKYKLIRIENREYYKQLEQDYIWELLPPWEQNGSNGSDGKDGGYYTPSVDASGNLTWTPSDPSMPSVSSSNIKGPKGDTGDTGPQGPAGQNGADGEDGAPGADGQDGTQGPQGIQGPAGANGTNGEDGGYYTPSVDTSGNLTWIASKASMATPPASVNIKGPQGDPGDAADAVMVVTLTGTTSSHSSTEIYNALKAGKMVYGIVTLQSGDLGDTTDNYTGEGVCYPSYPFSANKVTFFTIGEVEANIGGKLGYLILYVSGTTVSVHDEGTIWNLEPEEPVTT